MFRFPFFLPVHRPWRENCFFLDRLPRNKSFHNWNPTSKIDGENLTANVGDKIHFWFSLFPILSIQTFSKHYSNEINSLGIHKRGKRMWNTEEGEFYFRSTAFCCFKKIENSSFLLTLELTLVCSAFECSLDFFFIRLLFLWSFFHSNHHYDKSTLLPFTVEVFFSCCDVCFFLLSCYFVQFKYARRENRLLF